MSNIVTFYSYKGGVGRTLALANIGILLAQQGKRVLLMDWDLEAPGLDRYFAPYQHDPSPDQGVIQLLHQAATDPDTDWRSHMQQVNLPARKDKTSCNLSIIPSGIAALDYAEKIRGFSWENFLAQQEGGTTLERWRGEWKKEFDLVLIDSRTGITDTGGICTILLPDFLVLAFTANEQSYEGALKIAKSAQAERRKLSVPRPPLMVLPLLSRFDRRDELEESDKWLRRFATGLKPFYDDWLPNQFEPIQIIELTKVPYVTRFSFGEPLPVLTHSLTDPEMPGFYLNNAARLLASNFREAARIVDPNASEPLDKAAKVRSKIKQSPIDERELDRLLRDAEKELGEGSELASLLYDVGSVLQATGRLDEAEPLFRRALAITEVNYGSEHPAVAAALRNLAALLQTAGRLDEAEPLVRRALAITETSYGSEHVEVATAIIYLARLLRNNDRLAEAEPLVRRALAITEANYGSEHPAVGTVLNLLAQLLLFAGRLDEAEPLFRRALAITENSYGSEHVEVATVLDNLAGVLRSADRLDEAEPLVRRALAITEANYGSENRQIATPLSNLAALLQTAGRLDEAEPLVRRVLEITEANYGSEHPMVAIALGNLGGLLQATGCLDEAEPLFRRALAITEANYGSEHSKLAMTLNNLMGLLRVSGRRDEAELLVRQAVVILLKISAREGNKLPQLDVSLGNYKALLTDMGNDDKKIDDTIKSLIDSVESEHSTPVPK